MAGVTDGRAARSFKVLSLKNGYLGISIFTFFQSEPLRIASSNAFSPMFAVHGCESLFHSALHASILRFSLRNFLELGSCSFSWLRLLERAWRLSRLHRAHVSRKLVWHDIITVGRNCDVLDRSFSLTDH